MADHELTESEADSGDEESEDEQPSAQEDDEQDATAGKKKKINMPRMWMEVERWKRSDHSDEDIDVFVRKHLDDLNRSAGILYSIPGAHKNRNNQYGDFQFRRKWQTHKGQLFHVAVSCPFRDRCNCECEAKITHAPAEVTLYFHKAHTAVDHLEKDTGKYLKFQQKYLIADAVKVAPLQTATELI